MADLADLPRPVRSRGSDLRALVGVFVGMQIMAALIWIAFMTFRPTPAVPGVETSVRGAVMEALADHLTPPPDPVLVERPRPRKTAAPVLKATKATPPPPAPAPAAASAVATWEPPPPPPVYEAPPPAPRYYAPPPPRPAPAPRVSSSLSAPQRAWLQVDPPQGEH